MMLEAEKDGKKRDIVMKRSNRNMFCVELVAIENAAREPAVFLHSCFFFSSGLQSKSFQASFCFWYRCAYSCRFFMFLLLLLSFMDLGSCTVETV